MTWQIFGTDHLLNRPAQSKAEAEGPVVGSVVGGPRMGQELKPGEAELLIELAERLGVRLVPWQVQVLLQFLRSLEQQRAVGPRNRRIASLVSSQLCKLAHAAWNRLKP